MTDPNGSQQVEVEVCCDALLEALEQGIVQVVDVGDGPYREVIPDPTGQAGVAINFCPFCGASRLPPSG
jgi:hypothetical protein